MAPARHGLCLLLAFAVASASREAADDIATLRARLLTSFCWLPGTNLSAQAELSTHYALTLNSSKQWSDVNYSDPFDRTVWKTSDHLSRVLTMARAVSTPGSPAANSSQITTALREALAWWLEFDPQDVNWWFDIIFVPQSISSIYLMLGVTESATTGGFPSQWDMTRGMTLMMRAAWWNASLGYEVTQANLMWMLQVQLVRGVLPFAVNASAIDGGFARAWQEAHVVNRSMDFSLAQGIQHDWSFAFHGPQLQIGSYGQDYMTEFLVFIAASYDTPWAMPNTAASVLCSYAARGMAWLSVGRSFPWTGVGRQCSRPTLGSEFGISLNASAVRALSTYCTDADDAAGIAVWADRLEFLPPSPTSPALVGSRHFFTTDLTSVKRTAWAADLRLHSNRTDIPECGNGENLAGRYMSEGVLNIYNTTCGVNGDADTSCGKEWGNVFPLLQWTRLGGILSNPTAPLAACSGQCCWSHTGYVSRLPFVGGSSDGYLAVSAMDTAITGGPGVTPLTAHRTWVFFGDSILSLTANMTGGASGLPAETSLSQRFLHDTRGILVGSSEAPTGQWLPDGEYSAVRGTWAWSDGVGWLFGSGIHGGGSTSDDVLTISSGVRNGTWQSIGAMTGDVVGRVATLALAHGVSPASGGDGLNSVYAALPGLDASLAPSAVGAASAALTVTNTAAAQGGGHAGERAAAAVFWPRVDGVSEGGSVTLSSAPNWTGAPFAVTLSADASCLVTYAEVGGTIAYISVSSPLSLSEPLHVTVSRTLSLLPTPAPARSAGGTVPIECLVSPSGGGGSVLTFALPPDANTTQGMSIVMACALGGGVSSEALPVA